MATSSKRSSKIPPPPVRRSEPGQARSGVELGPSAQGGGLTIGPLGGLETPTPAGHRERLRHEHAAHQQQGQEGCRCSRGPRRSGRPTPGSQCHHETFLAEMAVNWARKTQPRCGPWTHRNPARAGSPRWPRSTTAHPEARRTPRPAACRKAIRARQWVGGVAFGQNHDQGEAAGSAAGDRARYDLPKRPSPHCGEIQVVPGCTNRKERGKQGPEQQICRRGSGRGCGRVSCASRRSRRCMKARVIAATAGRRGSLRGDQNCDNHPTGTTAGPHRGVPALLDGALGALPGGSPGRA